MKVNKRHGLVRFREICQLRKEQRTKHLQARGFNLNKMFTASLKSWVNYYKSHLNLIKKQVVV